MKLVLEMKGKLLANLWNKKTSEVLIWHASFEF